MLPLKNVLLVRSKLENNILKINSLFLIMKHIYENELLENPLLTNTSVARNFLSRYKSLNYKKSRNCNDFHIKFNFN